MSNQNQFLLYTAPDGAVKVDVYFKNETVWLTQKALATLFGVNVPGINKRLKNIFDSRELSREATISKMEIAQTEGDRVVKREVEYYNLDAIIAVYRQRQDAEYISDFDREIKRLEGIHPEARKPRKKKPE